MAPVEATAEAGVLQLRQQARLPGHEVDQRLVGQAWMRALERNRLLVASRVAKRDENLVEAAPTDTSS